jgi:hypothetical protein
MIIYTLTLIFYRRKTMKTNFRFLFGILVILMAGIFFTGCKQPTDGDGDEEVLLFPESVEGTWGKDNSRLTLVLSNSDGWARIKFRSPRESYNNEYDIAVKSVSGSVYTLTRYNRDAGTLTITGNTMVVAGLINNFIGEDEWNGAYTKQP